MRVENDSPLRSIKSVMTAGPGTEAVFGLLMPPAISLFEPDSNETASIVLAREDHKTFTKEMKKRGIDVFNMRRIIGQTLAKRDKTNFRTAIALQRELHRRAELLHQKYGLGNLDQAMNELDALLQQDIQEMGLDAALAINAVLTNIMSITGRELPFDPAKPPAANFMFWRDTNHITGRELGIHKMFYPIRQQEVALARLGFEALEIEYKTLLPLNSPHSIEGGDVLPMELNRQKYALIGQAERTSRGGVDAWFTAHEKQFSASGAGLIPLVVEGPNHDTQDQMHLDTYAQQIGRDAIIHCGEISRNRQVSVLKRVGGSIVRVDTQRFQDWLENSASQVLNMSREAQVRYAPNVLVDGGRDTVYMTRADSPEVEKFIREQVGKVVLMRLNNLTKLYGGAHCSTSEIR